MKKLSYAGLVTALQNAGVNRGGIVHVQSDLCNIGPVDAAPDRNAILEFYLAAFQEALGPEGTLTCCTAFEDYARYGTPFVRETSPSLTDTFSEYIRSRPGSVRSMHPLVSVTALGPKAEQICGGVHYEGFGYNSPWGRLHRAGALLLSLGLNEHQGGTTFFHYVESLYSVPYKYTKAYTTPVYADGKQVEGLFTMSVRYLDFGIVNTPIKVKTYLMERGYARITPLGYSKTWSCPAQHAFSEVMTRLDTDRYFLLEKPPRFRQGEIPCDGNTGDMQWVVDKGDETS